MKRSRRLVALALPLTVAVAVALTVLPSLPGFAAPGDTTRVSVASDGSQVAGHSDAAVISADGRFVAFDSDAFGLVPGDTNGMADIFVRDRVAGTTERVSVPSDGSQANSKSSVGSISGDGRFVAFVSHASNLVPGDSNGNYDIFVRDRVAGTTERVSVGSDGSQANNDSFGGSISADGRFVAFQSYASNLVPVDSNSALDVFVRDRSARTTERVSVASDGTQANDQSFSPALSADGRFVVFLSGADNLVPGDTNSRYAYDVFVHDRVAATTERVNLASDGTQDSGASNGSLYPSVSADGRFVAFWSDATNLVAGDTNGAQDIFVRDRLAGTTERVSVASDGSQGNGGNAYSSISGDGRFVAFASLASNLVPEDTNSTWDVFVRDRASHTTERANVAYDGSQTAVVVSGPHPSISSDGRFVAFTSDATTLVPGDTNGAMDVFVHERGTAGLSSLRLNGTDAYAEAPNAPELNATDWTIEVWFKDEILTSTYNHPRARILTKGDITSSEVPYFVSIESNLLYVGLRSSGTPRVLTYNLATGGISPNAWHHLAATFQSSTHILTVYIDGAQRAQSSLGASSSGNGLPLIVGRSGTVGDYWKGKLDDLRIWNVVRSGADIQANYQRELTDAPSGLVGHWRFNEGAGSVAADSAGAAQNLALHGGAAFSPDVPIGPSSPPTPSATTTPTPTPTHTPTRTATPMAGGMSSLSLNGTTAYAEAPHAAESSPTSWTFEVWFKDANPTYGHGRTRILTKGDIASSEVPYFASIDSNLLYVGLRSGGAARTLTFNLATGGVGPNVWHHLAASFEASTRRLAIYIDGALRAEGILASGSSGNALPLIIGRSGTAGDYWKGQLDDLRIWNVVRAASEIAANYQTELSAPSAGLVGNWRFDEGFGTTAADSAGTPQNAALLGGATWSTDVPQPTVTPPPTPGGKLYWTSLEGTGAGPITRVSRSNLDGTATETLASTQGSSAIGWIAVDTAAGRMYWPECTVGSLCSGRIRRANLDGTSIQDIVTGQVPLYEGIALDPVGAKVY